MNYRMSLASRVLLAAGLALAWVGAADGQSGDGEDRDPALLLQRTRRSRETPRNYESSMDIDLTLMRMGQPKKKEKPVSVQDIPEARDGFSLGNLAPRSLEAYAPPVRPDREEKTKKNWILPPKPRLDEEQEPGELSDDPAEMMMQMYEDEVAARRSMIEGVLSGSSFTLRGSEERSPREDESSSRYSNYDGGLREAADNFLYSEEDELEDESDDTRLGYSPVIMDTAFQDEENRATDGTAIARLNPDQLEGLSDEELAALADRQSQLEENDVGLDDAERLSGIEQFTREGGGDQPSLLTRTQAILSGSRLVPSPADGEASGSSPAPATLGNDSWQGSLSTLSSVLNTTPAASMPPGAKPRGSTIFGGGVTDGAMSRIRDQFSPGSGRSSPIGFTPAASTGLGSIGSDLARPTSLGLGSGFSSGVTGSGVLGGGASSVSPSLSPAPRKRSLDVRNLDILMN